MQSENLRHTLVSDDIGRGSERLPQSNIPIRPLNRHTTGNVLMVEVDISEFTL